jgi:hypothetical protein
MSRARTKGLEIGLDLAVLDRAAQLLAQRHAALAILAEFVGEMPRTAAAFRLGVEQREVGVLEQILGVGRIFRECGDADRGAHGERLLAEVDRPVEQAAQLLADQARLGGVVDVLADDHELVAAEARDHGIGRHLELQLLRDDAQDLIAHQVAVDVVDVLEMVEVDPENRDAHAVLASRARPPR